MTHTSLASSPRTPDFKHTLSGDDELGGRIWRALSATGCPPLQSVHVVIQDGFITLHGHVPTYYMKQLAQTVVMNVDGVDSLSNDIEVC